MRKPTKKLLLIFLFKFCFIFNSHSLADNHDVNEILEKLQKVISCSFKVVHQRAGIRPTVVDRRPLVGQHKTHKNLFVLNGLGSRGVLIAPSVAKDLIAYIEDGVPLPDEIDINRFKS